MILNSKDGNPRTKINTPDNLLFIHPRWSEDGKDNIYALNFIAPLDAGLRSIYIPDTKKMEFEILFSLNFGGIY